MTWCSSLLWEASHSTRSVFADELGVEELSDLGLKDFLPDGISSLTAISYLSRDPATLKSRQELFAEFLADAGLFERMNTLFVRLEAFHLVIREKSYRGGVAGQLYSLRDVRLFLECIAELHEGFAREIPASGALRRLKESIEQYITSRSYRDLADSFGKVSDQIRDVRSITVGINLDAQLNASEAGIVSVNEKPFVSGHPIDRFLRAKWRKDPFVCRSPLIPVTKGLSQSENLSLNNAFTNALNKIILEATANWKSAVSSYIRSEGGCLSDLYCEWTWIKAVMESLTRLRIAGKALCTPEFILKGSEFTGLYHPCTVFNAHHQNSYQGKEEAFARLLFYLGIPIPAQRAGICVDSSIS